MFLYLLSAIILILLYLLLYLHQKNKTLEEKLSSLSFSKSSQSVKYGKTLEHWAPFLDSFPYSPEDFRFLGTPIDGLAFTEDKIIFCEIKTHSSQLNQKQKKIKSLVQDKKVEWLEFRIE